MTLRTSLLYHDVVPDGQYRSSGFSSPDADIYKLDASEFRRHLQAIVARGVRPHAGLFTFDDGGVSALEPTASLLEEFGFTGNFFVTTDFIGTPGFLTREQIRELHRRGHVIGSHSCSHPTRMALCPRDQLRREWSESGRVLADIIGADVITASVPGGFYSRAVAETAAESGIRVLYTSEPTAVAHTVGQMTVIGRYSVQQGIPASTAAELAAGDSWPRMKQAVLWGVKKAVKRVGGRYWLAFRTLVIARRTRGA